MRKKTKRRVWQLTVLLLEPVSFSGIVFEMKIRDGGLAQLGERLPCKQEVTSSTLVFSTRITDCALHSPFFVIHTEPGN